ncbi:GMC family oxidoreductase [Ruixingdingia sedimenti]|uniref:GMC family oxidoreductase n=1 Tax=Ruixingdingia sedimenti TaxID=3073604 RepID=A0ABU1F5M6_9RHOB|nr:GMC family oxidoreductase [Xinfangfangia sp. LG-4]MDR5652161.1 GMC family oxidoreductase [Xinfangfangia sp. LG-4]
MSVGDRLWDVIVIGAGMGGGIAGRRLAEAGLNVLFIDRGPMGPRAEEQALSTEIADPAARLIRGYWPDPLDAGVAGRQDRFFGALGAGAGGSSVFYAASLERPARHDFEDAPGLPHPTGGWPVGADAFAPWFRQAETLLNLAGTPDPLSPGEDAALRAPPPLSPAGAALEGAFRARGLHPYRMHVGIGYGPDCRECIGHKCPRPCKMDGRSAGVEPALATGRAEWLGGCLVTALHADAGRVRAVEVRRGAEVLRLRARAFVLAAGGLGSPALLLASRSELWPDGVANRSGMAGRNLMFHLNERIAIWPPGRHGPDTGPRKSLALRDFYAVEGQRFGLFQAMGLTASYGNIVQFLNDRFDRSALRRLRVLREFTRIPALIAARMLGEAHVYVGILEDLPYADNRVRVPAAPGAIGFDYRFAPELLARRRLYRRHIRRGLGGLRSLFLTFEPELNIGHPCGTLRFGIDPARSVLDPECRAHGVANLYVADSSFMPTATGVNPSLTIAANALRTADALVRGFARLPEATP